MNRPNITAHSGCDGTKDGSVEAIRKGIELGADYVEVDVRHVPGLGLALTHDVPDDTSGLVLFEDALRIIAEDGRIGINCDLKEHGLAASVINMAAGMGITAPRLVLSGSLTPAQLREDPTIAARAGVYLNIEEALCSLMLDGKPQSGASPWEVVRAQAEAGMSAWIDPLINCLKGLGIRALNLPLHPYIAPHLGRLADDGIRCSVWTINERDDMLSLFPLPHLENLTTRRVALAIEVRSETQREGNSE